MVKKVYPDGARSIVYGGKTSCLINIRMWALGSVHTWCPGTVPGFYSTPGTNVNTPFFLVPTPEFGHGAGARVQGLDLVLGH